MFKNLFKKKHEPCIECYVAGEEAGIDIERGRVIALIKDTIKGCPLSSNEIYILAGLLKDVRNRNENKASS